MRTPVNGRTLRQHFTYNWWKYLLVIACGIFLVDLLFTVTAPRTPEDKKVEFYVYGYADMDRVSAYMEKVREQEMPGMQEMIANQILPDNSYGPMQLITYLAAGEGDLYLLPREEFLSVSSDGAFVALEDDQELMDFFTARGLDLRRGWRTDSNGETHLVGIPESFLPGLAAYCQAGDGDGFLCIPPNGGNIENTLTFLHILCRDMITTPEPAPETEKAESSD